MNLTENQTKYLVSEHFEQINSKLTDAAQLIESEKWADAQVELEFAKTLTKLAKSRLSTL